MRTLFIILLFALPLCTSAQVIRLHATASRYYSLPQNPSAARVDSVDYYYTGDRGLSAHNGNFIADITAYYTNRKKSSYTEKKYNSLDEEAQVDNFHYPYKTQTTTTYDNNNRKQSVYSLTDHGQGLFSSSLHHYTYDGTGNLVEIKARNQQYQSPLNWYIVNNTYDANSNLLTEVQQSWDSISNIYTPGNRRLYIYNTQNQCIEKKQQLWYNNQWNEYSLLSYTYDAGGNLQETIHEGYYNNAWHLLDKTNNTYTTANKILEKQVFDWVNNSYKLATKDVWTYTSFNQPQSHDYIRYTTDTTFHTYTWYYYGVHWTTGVDEPETNTNELQLFPNPATGNHFTLHTTKVVTGISITDIKGQQVLSDNNKLPPGNHQFNINLEKGIYTITITYDNGQQAASKLVKL